MTVFAWALVAAAAGGISLAAGALTPEPRRYAVLSLILFTVSAVLTLVGALG